MSNARDGVSALFTDDATYRFSPTDALLRGFDGSATEW